MPQPPASQDLASQPPPSIGSVDYTVDHDYNGSHPPHLTHANDINTSVSNDESTERTENAPDNDSYNTNSIANGMNGDEQKKSEEDGNEHRTITKHGDGATDSSFGLNYSDKLPQIPQTLHAFTSPFGIQHNAAHDNRNNLVPSPFTMRSGVDRHANYEYVPRHYGAAQRMVDVPHVQPQIGVESDDVLAHNENNNERRRKGDEMASKYESIKDSNANLKGSVKGGAGNGYRMVLDQPVKKSQLSCHQCKCKKRLDQIIVCGHVYRIHKTVKTCTKKYCKSCLLRFYLQAPPTDNQDPTWSLWKCPCCRYICCCAWCRKKKAKRLESVSNAIRAEAHRLTPAISLARKLVSESRVNNSNGDNSNSKKKRHTDIPPQI
eukprot:767446_1